MTKAPDYLSAVIDEARRHGRPGTVGITDVWHDDDCSFWAGGACDCRPVVKARRLPRERLSKKERLRRRRAELH